MSGGGNPLAVGSGAPIGRGTLANGALVLGLLLATALANPMEEAIALRNEGSFPEAVKAFDAIGTRQAQAEKAITLAFMGQHREALEIFKSLRPIEEKGYALMEARVAIWAGRYAEGRRLARAWLEEHPDDPDALAILALADRAEWRVRRAREIHALIPDHPETVEGLNALDDIRQNTLRVWGTAVIPWGQTTRFEGIIEFERWERSWIGWELGYRYGTDPVLGVELGLPVEGAHRVWAGMNWRRNGFGFGVAPRLTLGNGTWVGVDLDAAFPLGKGVSLFANVRPGWSAKDGADFQAMIGSQGGAARWFVRGQAVYYIDPERFQSATGFVTAGWGFGRVWLELGAGVGWDTLGWTGQAMVAVPIRIGKAHIVTPRVLHLDGRSRISRVGLEWVVSF